MAGPATTVTAASRRGRLRLERLTAEHGPDTGLPTLRHSLAGACPRRAAREAERCDVYFPGLVGLFAGEGGGRNSRGSPAS